MGCGLRVAGKKGIVGRGQKADSRSQISDNRKQMTEDRRIGKSECGKKECGIRKKAKSMELGDELTKKSVL
jgi:hypothetical protein